VGEEAQPKPVNTIGALTTTYEPLTVEYWERRFAVLEERARRMKNPKASCPDPGEMAKRCEALGLIPEAGTLGGPHPTASPPRRPPVPSAGR
jgi:hypothetical protein